MKKKSEAIMTDVKGVSGKVRAHIFLESEKPVLHLSSEPTVGPKLLASSDVFCVAQSKAKRICPHLFQLPVFSQKHPLYAFLFPCELSRPFACSLHYFVPCVYMGCPNTNHLSKRAPEGFPSPLSFSSRSLMPPAHPLPSSDLK